MRFADLLTKIKRGTQPLNSSTATSARTMYKRTVPPSATGGAAGGAARTGEMQPPPRAPRGALPVRSTEMHYPTDQRLLPRTVVPPPVNTSTQPVNTGAPPANTGAAPANTGAPPANTGAVPVNTGAVPVNTGAPPANLAAPPPAPLPPPAIVAVQHGIIHSLKRRADKFIDSAVVAPRKRARCTPATVDESEELAMLRKRLRSDEERSDCLVKMKRALYTANKTCYDAMKADPNLSIATLEKFAERLLCNMSYDTKMILATDARCNFIAEDVIGAVLYKEMTDTDNDNTVFDMKEYTRDLRKKNMVGTTLVEDLLKELQATKLAAATAHQAHVAKELEITTELLATTQELVACKKLLEERTGVMKILAHASAVPACAECHTMLLDGPARLHMTACGITLCNLCIEKKHCPLGHSKDDCNQNLYTTGPEEFVAQVKYIRQHVMAFNDPRVVSFEEHAPVPEFLANYMDQQHKDRVRLARI
jgi:hypothetical protein